MYCSDFNVFFIDIDLDDAIKSIKRLYKSSLDEIDKLFVDDHDHHGLIYWYEDAKDYIKQINNSMGGLS
jgi:site-specific recombinase